MNRRDLPVPNAALDHYVAIRTAGEPHYLDTDVACVQAIAAPVVAALLRREVENLRYEGGFDDAHALYLAEMLEWEP